MPAVNWDEIPDEPVRPGVRRRGFGTNDVMLVRSDWEPGIRAGVENIDGFGPARDDFLHLLRWMR